jgi:hypothetical protein
MKMDKLRAPISDEREPAVPAGVATWNGLGLLLGEQRRLRRAEPRLPHYRTDSAWRRLRGRRDEATPATS